MCIKLCLFLGTSLARTHHFRRTDSSPRALNSRVVSSFSCVQGLHSNAKVCIQYAMGEGQFTTLRSANVRQRYCYQYKENYPFNFLTDIGNRALFFLLSRARIKFKPVAHQIALMRCHFNFGTGCTAQILNFSANGLMESCTATW